jgi:multicomponent Na+:H+ antiporter subunit E
MIVLLVLGRLVALVGLAAWASAAIVRASLMVARDVIAPSPRVAPGVVILPMRSRTPLEIAMVSGLIILTPGTMTVTIRPDEHELWVHGMYAADPEALRAELRDLEDRVLIALRGARGAP